MPLPLLASYFILPTYADALAGRHTSYFISSSPALCRRSHLNGALKRHQRAHHQPAHLRALCGSVPRLYLGLGAVCRKPRQRGIPLAGRQAHDLGHCGNGGYGLGQRHYRHHPKHRRRNRGRRALILAASSSSPLPLFRGEVPSPRGKGCRRIGVMKEKVSNLHLLKGMRRKLRNEPTPQEILLWSRLRNKQLGCKFRRQHSLGRYIADFYCREKNLIIEVDGSQHAERETYDTQRTRFFEGRGLRVLRFWNSEINTNMEGVLTKIQELLE